MAQAGKGFPYNILGASDRFSRFYGNSGYVVYRQRTVAIEDNIYIYIGRHEGTEAWRHEGFRKH